MQACIRACLLNECELKAKSVSYGYKVISSLLVNECADFGQLRNGVYLSVSVL